VIELELKAVVADPAALLARLRAAGAREEFAGRMLDRRLDFPDGSLTLRDEVVRVRMYQDSAGRSTASLDWKGPASMDGGFKRREEIGAETSDGDTILEILHRIGLRVTYAIDREIRRFSLEGATVRMEHFPRMDDLVEVEGDAAAIERAIARLAIPRAEFSAESLAAFTARYTARTGQPAVTGPTAEIRVPIA
jgi:adenylate cyclase class IV